MPKKQPKPPKPPKVPAGLGRTLVTPEGVDLGVELAPLSSRLAALVLDLLIVLGVLLLISLLIWALQASTPLQAPSETAAIVWFLGFFLLRNAWFVGWEMTPAAATPGKRVMKLRVAMRNGGRLTADAVFARNVTRELEMFLPFMALMGAGDLAMGSSVGGLMALALLAWTLAFGFIPFFNRDKLRAGDLLAGTWVVQAPRHTLQPDMAQTAAPDRFAFTLAQLDTYGVMELQVLEDVLRQKDRQVMRDVAGRIRQKIEWTEGADESDADFLRAYYTALRARLEKRMLFGHRRKDKHDRSGLG